MVKRILVVDDDRPAPAATVAKSSADAIRLLRRQAWDELWLDHDLGGDDTTWPVVRELERRNAVHADLGVESVIVHTANSVEAIRMLVALHKLPVQLRRATAMQMITELSGHSA
jgi:CheY-like chemotaxis protein